MVKIARIAITLVLGILLVSASACGGGPVAAPTPTPTPTPTPAKSIRELSLADWEWGYDSEGYIWIEGEVKNTGTASLDRPMVVAKFYDVEGQYVRSFSLIFTDYIGPGQTETFEMTRIESGDIRQATVTFKEWKGEDVPAIVAVTIPMLPPPPEPTPELQLLSWHWSRAYGYITVEGEVKNICGRSFENVMAHVVFRTEDEEYVTSADALIDYNPIMPNQTSPFTVMQTDNPLIYWASLSFKYLLGGTIPTKYPD